MDGTHQAVRTDPGLSTFMLRSGIPRAMTRNSQDNAAASRPLAVTYRATADLRPDPRHARTRSKRQIEQIVASIRAFGFTSSILIDPDCVLIAGRGRLLAARSMGLAAVSTIQFVGLSDAQKRALRLADNKITLDACWGPDVLKVEVAELSSLELEPDLTVTGFPTGELDMLLRAGEDPEDDAIPPVPAIMPGRS
jgi:hypothetical protein